MNEKYSEINLLVHPLFDLISFIEIKSPKEDELDLSLITKNKDFLQRYKKSLMVWGEVISKMKPNSIFMLLEPTPVIKGNNRFIYEELTHKFYKFAKEKLKDRFIVVSSKYMLFNFDKELISKLNNKIKIKAFGEYTKMCVNKESKELKKILKTFGKISTIEIIEGRSLYSHNELSKGLGKQFLPKTKKRKLQNKIKKLKR